MNSDSEGGNYQAPNDSRPINLASRNVSSQHQIDTSDKYK